MQRELKLTYRDRFNYYSRTFQIAYLAFLSATLFIKPGHDTVAEGQLFLLEIFFAALVSIFAGFGKVKLLLLKVSCCLIHQDLLLAMLNSKDVQHERVTDVMISLIIVC